MAKKKNKKIDELINRFGKELMKEIPVEKILLFGSYAKGNPDKRVFLGQIIKTAKIYNFV